MVHIVNQCFLLRLEDLNTISNLDVVRLKAWCKVPNLGCLDHQGIK